MKKQISLKLYLCTVIGLVACIILTVVTLVKRNVVSEVQNYEVVSLQYDSYMNGFKVENYEGEILEKLPCDEKYNVIFYLSSTCHGCVEILENFERLKSVFGENNINFIFLWTDNMPKDLIAQYQINMDFCYKMVDKKFAAATPTYFIVDESSKVKFLTVDAYLLVEKLVDMEIVQQEILIGNASQYIKTNFFNNSTKKKMVYFAMKGCPDCEAANPIVESGEIENIYDVVKIYKYDDQDISHIRDVYGIFKQVYGIKWYPSFLIFDNNDIEIIGETPVDNLKSVFMNQ